MFAVAPKGCFASAGHWELSQQLEWELGLTRRQAWTAGQAQLTVEEGFGVEEAALQPLWVTEVRLDEGVTGSLEDTRADCFVIPVRLLN